MMARHDAAVGGAPARADLRRRDPGGSPEGGRATAHVYAFRGRDTCWCGRSFSLLATVLNSGLLANALPALRR